MTPDTKDVKRERSKRKSPETLRDKVQRHLHDKTDIITDEDIRDAIVSENDSEKASRITEITEQTTDRTEENKTSENTGSEVPENKQTTPWNILSEGYD
jgi:hypothetical protein